MKIISKLLIVLLVILQIGKLHAQHSRSYKNIYRPLEKNNSAPKVFREFDAKLRTFYSETYPKLLSANKRIIDYFNEMDSTEFLQWAKLIVQINYYPMVNTYKYTNYLDKTFFEQRKRRNEAQKSGIDFTEKMLIMPSNTISSLGKKIKREFSREWQLSVMFRQMLIVEVIGKEIGGLAYNPDFTGRVYSCKVITDLKGYYKNNPVIKIIMRHNSRDMEIGKKYLTLISSNSGYREKRFAPCLISWDNIIGQSIFDVENGNILDPDNILQFNALSFSIESYQRHFHSFFEMIFEGDSNEN